MGGTCSKGDTYYSFRILNLHNTILNIPSLLLGLFIALLILVLCFCVCPGCLSAVSTTCCSRFRARKYKPENTHEMISRYYGDIERNTYCYPYPPPLLATKTFSQYLLKAQLHPWTQYWDILSSTKTPLQNRGGLEFL